MTGSRFYIKEFTNPSGALVYRVEGTQPSGKLPWPIIPKRLWPEVRFKEKRAITREEHQLIIGREMNPERRNFYELCWHLGGSQTDIAKLKAESVA